MTTAIRLFRSSQLGFDLDTKRPLFQSASIMAAFEAAQTPVYSYNSSNFNRIGDPMLLPLDYGEAAKCDVGTFKLGTILFWFRVRDIFVNEANRTQIVYDIDYAMSYYTTFTRGRVLACPKGTKHARAPSVSPRYWKYDAVVSGARYGTQVAIVVKQFSSNHSGTYDVKGPVYILMSCQWSKLSGGVLTGTNPIDALASKGYFALTDIVNCWLVPGFLHSTNAPRAGNLAYWNSITPASGDPFYWVKWTNSTGFASYDLTVSLYSLPDAMKSGETYDDGQGFTAPYLKGTDTAEGVMTGFCDERGNILFMFPDRRKIYNSLYIGVRLSMASCEVDIVLNGHENGFISGHTTDLMFTYSCRPIDVIGDSWQDYLFRQRDADVESRKIQNEQALAGAAGAALTGAMTGAMLGSVVPGIGTAAGAIAGGVAGLATSAVAYGINSYYGEKQQGVTDQVFQLAQDTMAVSGMITSYAIALQNCLNVFQISMDDWTKAELDAKNAIMGVPADGFTLTMFQDMAEAMDADNWKPWACIVEPEGITVPASWKKIMSEQMARGACWKKFGVWT